jgi:hypothetical protein
VSGRALRPASLVAAAAALALAALAFALAALAFALALTINTPIGLSSTRYQIQIKADVSAWVLAFLALALAVSAREAVVARRAALGLAWAASVAAALAFCIVGVVLAYRGGSGFTVLHAYAWVGLARTTGFAALALGVLAPPVARRTAFALVAAVGLAAVGTTVFSLTRGAGEPTFSLATTLAVLAAAVAFPGRGR